ncbi:hypothetical protein G6F68_017221 [Rhizopus microsporus]|uniref:Uncharacterized protein n=1 Tax=Rhizopus delemar TaxID=936053 RepID=A0A9P7C0X1_9FUNG|nr:hypothetical protein G6F68_017221 [Rhizopus microsporus]KAG1531015.1 hypothetical protein G6F50_016943 [Rhizopus delemar]
MARCRWLGPRGTPHACATSAARCAEEAATPRISAPASKAARRCTAAIMPVPMMAIPGLGIGCSPQGVDAAAATTGRSRNSSRKAISTMSATPAGNSQICCQSGPAAVV